MDLCGSFHIRASLQHLYHAPIFHKDTTDTLKITLLKDLGEEKAAGHNTSLDLDLSILYCLVNV